MPCRSGSGILCTALLYCMHAKELALLDLLRWVPNQSFDLPTKIITSTSINHLHAGKCDPK
jgi:hypothetical protein